MAFDDCWGFGVDDGDDADGGDGCCDNDDGTVAVTVAVGWLVVDIFIYLFFCPAFFLQITKNTAYTRRNKKNNRSLERSVSVSVYQVSNYPNAENPKKYNKFSEM